MQALLDLGADMEQRDFEGETALFGAAFRGHAHVVRFLLERGATADLKNQFGQTPAQRAAKAGHQDVIALLPS